MVLGLVVLTGSASAYFEDEYTPEISARVARVSVLKGDAQIKREGGQEWERVTVNLPLTEGCEIILEDDSRMEIQLDSWNYLRLSEGSRIKVVTLNDDGVAVSLISGTATLRIGNFDAEKNFFEIDAPKSTIAVKAKGSYRIDAGDDRSNEVRVTVGDGGEARLYSESSGFTVRSSRSAILYLIGDRAGEWETSAAARGDAFDRWNDDRDESIQKKLRDTHFGKYYDTDQYGAEDLSDNGEWIYTSAYGYVWRPYRNVTSRYRDWSPYRYGHWRWFPPYGWTWVNDEPWGWVTYHHGRWFFHAGSWHWSPYSAYRWRRSWWRPALVTIVVYNGRTCWYPMSYYASYYDFNRRYYSQWRDRWGHRERGDRDGRGWRGDRGDRVGQQTNTDVRNINPGGRFDRKPVERVPPTGVVAVKNDEFGRTRGGGRTAPPDVVTTVLSDRKDIIREGTDLPDWGVTRGGNSEIRVENPRIRQLGPPARTGASERTAGSPMDPELEKKKIFQDRIPTRRPPVRDEGGSANGNNDDARRPGAVDRNVIQVSPPRSTVTDRKSDGDSTGGTTEVPRGRITPRPIDRDGATTRPGQSNTTTPKTEGRETGAGTRTERPPIFSRPPSNGSDNGSGNRTERPPTTSRPPVVVSPPTYSRPPKTEAPREDPGRVQRPPAQRPPVYSRPPQTETPRSNPTPRNEPPPRQTPPRSEPPRSSPPPKSEPRQSPKESPSKQPPLRRKSEPE